MVTIMRDSASYWRRLPWRGLVTHSVLLSATFLAPQVASYEFTTLTCVPGMIRYRGAKIQLLDLPGIIEGAKDGKGRGRQVIATARTCNLILIVLDCLKPITHKKLIEHELEGVLGGGRERRRGGVEGDVMVVVGGGQRVGGSFADQLLLACVGREGGNGQKSRCDPCCGAIVAPPLSACGGLGLREHAWSPVVGHGCASFSTCMTRQRMSLSRRH